MARPSDKLAESLEALQSLQDRGMVAVRSKDLSRADRERLLRNGFLQKVVKGWYIPAAPDKPARESTAWYAFYWRFCAAYFQHRFGKDWCLSPEQSLALHAGNWTVPRQLLVRSAGKARNNATELPHGTSVLDMRMAIPEDRDIEERDGLRLFGLPAALIAVGPTAFRQSPTDLRAALSMIRSASEVLGRLLEGGHSTIAGRLAGAFRNIGRERIADEVVKTMRAAGYTIRELFGPSVTAGLVRPADLAGYRNGPVYIRRSMHVPPNPEAVRDTMPAFFDLLREEAEPSVRIVLGHFIFVYIHPYMDGNGRMGRFLMNVMLAAAGYPWTVIPVELRTDYMDALEEASVHGNIELFTEFIAALLQSDVQRVP